MIVTANDVKTKGISHIDELVQKYGEVFISVRGKRRLVILEVEEFERLREAALEEAIREAERDYEEGRYRIEGAEEHFKRLGI